MTLVDDTLHQLRNGYYFIFLTEATPRKAFIMNILEDDFIIWQEFNTDTQPFLHDPDIPRIHIRDNIQHHIPSNIYKLSTVEATLLMLDAF